MLSFIQHLIIQKKLDKAGKSFNSLLADTNTKISTSFFSQLYEIDKELEEAERHVFFQQLEDSKLEHLSDPIKVFLRDIKSSILHDPFRIITLENLQYDYPLDVGIQCCYFKAIAEQSSEDKDLKTLKKAFDLYKTLNHEIELSSTLAIDRANVLMKLVQELCNQNKYEEGQNLISSHLKAKWLNKTNLTPFFVTIANNLDLAITIQSNSEKKHNEEITKIRNEISNQKLNLIEIIAIFIAIITIVGISFQTSQEHLTPLREKIAFISATTICMLLFLSIIFFLLQKGKTLVCLGAICIVSTLFLISIFFLV